jgi:spore maturation protein CgeB
MTLLGSNDRYLTKDKELKSRRRPRICMLTARSFARETYRCSIYESEDILLDVDDVDLIYLKPGKACELRQNIHERIVWHDFTKKMVFRNMAFQPVRLAKEYDLFVVYMPLMRDLIRIPAIRNWKDYCRSSVCWINEVWAADVPILKSWLPALDDFDHVVLGQNGTVKAVSDAIKRPCHFLPGAVDAIRFSPYPKPPPRVIDVYGIGRIWEEVHHALVDVAAKRGIFYIYDTFHASVAQVKDYRQHREMFANMAKRSRFFFVAPAKMDIQEETKGQVEVGFRFYEASAAGAIMLGQAPDCESFRRQFDWPQAVVEIQPDGSDTEKVISRLSAEPERLREISCRNAEEALRRHDWVYRWKEILDIAGLRPTPAMEAREKRLRELAELARESGR